MRSLCGRSARRSTNERRGDSTCGGGAPEVGAPRGGDRGGGGVMRVREMVEDDPIQVGLWSWVIGSGVVLVVTVVLPTIVEVLF